MRNCKLCDNFVISDSVTFAGENLVIDIPAGNYGNGQRYCLVVAQSIPAEATIGAPVFISIGGVTTTLYPLNKCNCQQAVACNIRARTKYPVVVVTSATSGSFRLLSKVPCAPGNALASLPAGDAA